MKFKIVFDFLSILKIYSNITISSFELKIFANYFMNVSIFFKTDISSFIL
jgi:hypothetical protein